MCLPSELVLRSEFYLGELKTRLKSVEIVLLIELYLKQWPECISQKKFEVQCQSLLMCMGHFPKVDTHLL